MAGHSKWKQIKHKKAAKDIKKGAAFSKLSRMITLAVAEGGGIADPDKNVKLRLAIEKARESNMPKDNISRAIEKGSGPEKNELSEVVYEAFGPSGINLMIQTATDNPNRTLSEIRNILDRNGGKLGVHGSVAYLFTKCGVISFEKTKNPQDKVLEFSEKISAFDIEEDDDSITVYLPFENLSKVKDAINGLTGSAAEIDYKPQTQVRVENSGDAKKILALIEALEAQEDVSHVFANFDIPEEFM
jgi:YebC/PmpR family DNA-binding regulatory protein